MRTNLIIAAAVAGSLLIAGTAFAKTASCPCSPCKCGVCTCGGGGGGGGNKSHTGGGDKGKTGGGDKGKSGEGGKTVSKGHDGGGHHEGRGHHDGHGHGGGSVGVGISVDLSGIGRRSAEPDPFAAGGGPQPVAHTEEKPVAKTKTRGPELPRTTGFEDVKLTGQEAKAQPTPGGPINVADNEPDRPPSPPAENVDNNKPAVSSSDQPSTALQDLSKAHDAYMDALIKFLNNDPDWKQSQKVEKDAKDSHNPEYKAQLEKKAAKLGDKARDKFKNSKEGKELLENWMKAYADAEKPGANIPNDLVPNDKYSQAKHEMVKAQDGVNSEREHYNNLKNWALDDNPGVKNLQGQIDELKKKVHYSDADAKADNEKVKQLQAELDNTKKQVAKDWASTQSATDQMKKVQQAEKDLDKAKDALKPYDQLDKLQPKAASNP